MMWSAGRWSGGVSGSYWGMVGDDEQVVLTLRPRVRPTYSWARRLCGGHRAERRVHGEGLDTGLGCDA